MAFDQTPYEFHPQQTPENPAYISVEDLRTYAPGDVFLGSARRLMQPMVLMDTEQASFIGLNEEYDLRIRHGYSAYFYDLRTESHTDFVGEGHTGGDVRPTNHVGVLPEGVDINVESSRLMHWLLQESASMCAPDDVASKEHFEWLQDGVAAGELIISEDFDSPYVVTHVSIDSEARFRDYLRNNPGDNVALQHPPTAAKYL